MSAVQRTPFDLLLVADGVHAAIAVSGAGAQGNAAIVDLGDRTLVFDTLLTPEAGKALSRVRPPSGRPAAQPPWS